MLKSVKVPICESIVATPINYFCTNVYMDIVPEANYRPYSMERCGHILHLHRNQFILEERFNQLHLRVIVIDTCMAYTADNFTNM